MKKTFKGECELKISIWNKWVKVYSEYDLYGKHSVYPHWEYKINEFTEDQIEKAKRAKFGEEVIEILDIGI